jgi:hypothetical protein
LAFVNKGEQAVHIALPDKFDKADRLLRLDLRGASLTAKSGVQFGPVPQKKQPAVIEIAGYSATILQVG